MSWLDCSTRQRVRRLWLCIGLLLAFRSNLHTLISFHSFRDDADADFVNAVANALDLTKTLLFVTCGAAAEGSFFLFGPEGLVEQLGSQVLF